jgi:4-hydroxybenzoate polyprenyltransferase
MAGETAGAAHAPDRRKRGLAPALLRAMRPLQWSKNGLVFAALVFDRRFTDPAAVLTTVLAAACFCAASSAIYLLNDARDVERDRAHPRKRFRPIAAGELSVRRALIVAALLAVASVAGGVAIDPGFGGVVAGYLALMYAYNAGVKHMAILDVFAIAAGFVMRAAGGALAIDVPISPWLYVCTMLLALFVGFSKRRHELALLEGDAAAHRESLEAYTLPLLDQLIGILAAATVMTYSLYTFDASNVPENHALMLTIPFVVYAVFRFLMLVHRSELGGSPEAMLFFDRPLRLTIIGWCLTSAAILYLTR